MPSLAGKDTFKKSTDAETLYSSGAQRDSRAGKGAPTWVPRISLFLVSRIYENGNNMRGLRNWEKGMPVEDYLASAMRHIDKYLAGFRDEPHLPMAIWNLLNALQTSIWIRMGLLPKSLNTLPDHITGLEMGKINPLSPQEEDWLKAYGINLPEHKVEG